MSNRTSVTKNSLLDSTVVSVLASHAGYQGSIPRQRGFFVTKLSLENRTQRSRASIVLPLTCQASVWEIMRKKKKIDRKPVSIVEWNDSLSERKMDKNSYKKQPLKIYNIGTLNWGFHYFGYEIERSSRILMGPLGVKKEILKPSRLNQILSAKYSS